MLWALRDLSLDVQQGDVLGVIGSNGAGKSTFLKILARIVEPTTGYAETHGQVGALLEVGTGFHPELTGRENVLLSGAILGMSRREITRNFDAIVEFAEVERFIDTPVKRYSSGMHMRLAFSVAAHLEPDILLIDEVLAVGDAAFQAKCLGKMGEVAQRAGRWCSLATTSWPSKGSAPESPGWSAGGSSTLAERRRSFGGTSARQPPILGSGSGMTRTTRQETIGSACIVSSCAPLTVRSKRRSPYVRRSSSRWRSGISARAPCSISALRW